MTTATMNSVTRIHSRRTPHGFDAVVYRVGLSLAGWAHHRAQRQVPDRDERQLRVTQRLASERREINAEREFSSYAGRIF